MDNSKKLVDIVTEDTKNYIKNDFILKKYHAKESVSSKKEIYVASGEDVIKLVEEDNEFYFKTYHEDVWSSETGYVLLNDKVHVSVSFDEQERGNTTSVTVMGCPDNSAKIFKKLSDNLQINDKSFIKWVYNANGHYVRVGLSDGRLPVKEFYPFLQGKELAEYYQDFLDSSANVLILIGPPGTAKTSFIRGLLNYSKAGAVLSYNQNVLEEDSIFADFVSGAEKFFIVEDSDTFIKSRENGNTMMAKFLNVADGLIADKSKKLIFTTNLPSIKDVDEALIRKGRCYGVLEFRPLVQEEADVIAEKFDLPPVDGKQEYTIAEIFNPEEPVKDIKKPAGFGFGFGR